MDTTPLILLIGFALIVWPTALIVMWREVRKAPVAVDVNHDDVWAEGALAEYNAAKVDR